MPSLDTLIARIALSLWSSAKRVEKLPTVMEVQPWERAEIVAMPSISLTWYALAAQSHAGEGI